MTTTYRLAPDADLAHEDAREWYDSYGWHITTEHEGDVTLQAIPYDLAVERPRISEQVQAHLSDSYPDLTDDEVESLWTRAVEVREAADTVEALLAEAVEAYQRGDVAAVEKALDEAARVESEHGDSPASQSLRRQLIEEVADGGDDE